MVKKARRSQDKFPMAGSSGGGVEPDNIKMEFARRLQRAMVAKGWSQSELARRANVLLPTPARGQKQNNDFRRDLVSHYINGRHLPSAPNLAILAKALGIEPGDLLPKSAFPEAGGSPFAMTTLSNGRVNLQINRTMSSETAMKIAKSLAAEDAP
jgi:transcriptional regulator with XRE-family HTH domain